jgi:hypothetical protein
VGYFLFWAEMSPRSEFFFLTGAANPTKGFSFEKMAQSRHIWRRKIIIIIIIIKAIRQI